MATLGDDVPDPRWDLMFEKFRRFIRTNPDAANGQTDGEWLASGETRNPFPCTVIDCRSYVLNTMAATESREVAAAFARLRHSELSEVVANEPAHPLQVNSNFAIDGANSITDGRIFVAPSMDYKWDVYIHDGKIFARRSWTGQMVHVAVAEETSSGQLLIGKLISDSKAVFDGQPFAVAQLHFLLTTYLERRVRPFPIPPGFDRHGAEFIRVSGFSLYGRDAQYACLLESYKLS